ncbi:MAG: Zn-dependent hydrolase [Oliverpabstia sp.]
MEVDIHKVTEHLEAIYQCGAMEDGTHTRMAYSDEDLKGRELFRSYFEELGIPTRMDEAGNLIARLEGTEPDLPAIMTGSHLDTVPDGGKYDGVVGCVAGLGVCDALVRSGQTLKHPLEVIVFTDEEGFRFGSGLLGSSAICGEKLDIAEDDLDMYGQTRKDVFQNYGITVENVAKAKRDPESVHCFLELHVEQGGTLDKKQIPVGIVSSIAGVSRYEVRIEGEANHAGSTMMDDRKDALVTAAEFISEVPKIVKKLGGPYTVATVGTIKVTPNSVNVIPGTCTFHLEIRDQSAEVMKKIEEELKKYAETVCEEAGEILSWKHISYHKPAPMSEAVKTAIESAVKKQDIDYVTIPSGAFHDSLLMTENFPTGMIFVPSKDGISHSRYEFTREEDIRLGCNVLLETILQIDNMEINK